MKRLNLILIALLTGSFIISAFARSRSSSIRVIDEVLPTYSFSDPREYADFSRMYPYHRFDGYERNSTPQSWKMVEMENDYVKISVMPEIGGKIWGAIDKKTGQEFLYYNHVVKFRDVATRGPWTSGGLEMNFGIIGHSPWCSSKVDYKTVINEDGSVGCIIGGEDQSLGTNWRVAIVLPADKAYVETRVLWYNDTDWEKPFYQWMNAGIKTSGNLRYCYPGTEYLTHDGHPNPWPSEQGHQIDRYEENDFGHYKSYHVVGNLTDFWGGYWENEDFGIAHVSPYDDKLGKKIWIWGLSRYGMIWEDLLTDKDGQYSEVQSGKLFNQSIGTSFKTPFKHFSFMPGASYSWSEYWMPVQKIGGIDFCNTDMAYHWKNENGKLELNVYAVSDLDGARLQLASGGKTLFDEILSLHPTDSKVFIIDNSFDLNDYKVVLSGETIWDSSLHDVKLSRPQVSPDDFDYDSAYGLYLQGKEFERQNFPDKAVSFYVRSLKRDPYFIPSLVGLGGIYMNQNRYDDACQLAKTALSVNTYDAEANYLYARVSQYQGKIADAIDAYSVAMQTPSFMSVSVSDLSRLYYISGQPSRALHLLEKGLAANPMNMMAAQLDITFLRKTGRKDEALEKIDRLLSNDPLNYVAQFEKYFITASPEDVEYIKSVIVNEYRGSTYETVALYYQNLGLYEEAVSVLEAAGKSDAMVRYRTAYLEHLMGHETEAVETLKDAESMSPSLVFPHRREDEQLFKWCISTGASKWKSSYYLGLLYLFFDRTAEAGELFDSCGEKPDFYAFYIMRGLHISNTETDFKKALSLAPGRFACYLELAKYYMSVSQADKAVEVLVEYRKKDKENSYINLLLASAYRQTGEFNKGIMLMKSIVVLPNEGSLEGRNVWRESNISYSENLIRHKKYEKARKVISDARLWPENLGVGKPYEDSNDERLEDLLEWYIADVQGKDTSRYIESIATHPIARQPNAIANLFTAIALQKLGKGRDAEILEEWGKEYPDSQSYALAKAILSGNWEQADIIISKEFPHRAPLPFEILFDDRDLAMMIEDWQFFRNLLVSLIH